MSLLSINTDVIKEIEAFTNEHLESRIVDIDCSCVYCSSSTYQSQVTEKKFKFSPGHKALILQLPTQLQQKKHKTLPFMSQFEAMLANVENNPALSNILKNLVQDALKNFERTAKQHRYCDVTKYFATYLFIMCGRKAYEVLQSNLTLPAVPTIGMFNEYLHCETAVFFLGTWTRHSEILRKTLGKNSFKLHLCTKVKTAVSQRYYYPRHFDFILVDVISNIICFLHVILHLSALYLQQNKQKITEGELRCHDLKVYLEKIKAPKYVWLSEDGSGIVKRCVYDVKSNKLVGLNLPLDVTTGMPITSKFMANSLREIEKHMQNPLSYLVYVVMAQPVMQKAPPFVLQIFGTDNKFFSADVNNRWIHTRNELEKYV